MISFKNEDFAAYVRARVWKDYFKYRNDIIVWLCDLRQNTDGVANRLVARLAMRTLAGYAALDMSYAKRELIPYLERNFQKQRDVKYLEDFFRNLLRAPDCRESADTLLCRWCRRVPGILWQVPYRLYAQGEGLEFQSAAANALEEALWNDLTARPTLDSMESLEKAIAWLSEDRAYFLYPAHEDVVTAELLSEKIAALFLAQTKQATRYRTAEFFLMLLRWDYLTDRADAPELLFLRGLRKKAVREKILPLFRFIWRYAELRRMMERVLTAHLAEIVENHASYEYLYS